MLALDDWTRKSLQDALPPGAQFAWDGGMRVLVGWLGRGRAADPDFEPAVVLRFDRDVVAIIGEDVGKLPRMVGERARSLIRSHFGACAGANSASSPLVVDLDLHTLGFD